MSLHRNPRRICEDLRKLSEEIEAFPENKYFENALRLLQEAESEIAWGAQLFHSRKIVSELDAAMTR